jgi:hypothetical protein
MTRRVVSRRAVDVVEDMVSLAACYPSRSWLMFACLVAFYMG